MPKEKDNLWLAWKKALAAENRMSVLDRKIITAIKRDIKNSSVSGTYNLNTTLTDRLNRRTSLLKMESLKIGRELDDTITALAVRTIADASRINISKQQIKKIIDKVSLKGLSTQMRPSLNEYRHDLLYHLKRSIGGGKSVENIARSLQTVDLVKLDVPKYIREIELAARRTLQDPAHMVTFRKVLRKHSKLINNLTRAGEEGFEHLGLRRAGRAFLRDIQKAVNENTIDNVVDKWAKRKANYIQKRVARTETSRIYHENLREYASSAEHIKGVEVRLSESHPAPDICDELAGTYLFERDGEDFPIPPHHPQCICYMIYLFYEDFEEEAA